MDYIRLPSRPQTREVINTFYGLDKRRKIPDGYFRDMQNLSSDNYPLLSPRAPRGTIVTDALGAVTGMVMTAQGLCYTANNYLYLGLSGTRYDMGLSVSPKQLVRMGAYVLIFPDKKYINTADPEDRGDMEAEYTTVDATTFCICRPSGEDYAAEYISATEPEEPVDKGVWINTAEYPNTIHQWSESAKCWTQVITSCIRLFSMGIGTLFNVGDGITISGIKAAKSIHDMDTKEEITDEQREQLEALEGAAIILDKTDNSIVIEGVMDTKCSISSVITISRKLPTMDFVVERNNRLWGCRYGLDDAGEFVNILYASKLGDFRNWTVYRGIDTDSYYANVGTDGPFTGAIHYSYGNCVLFFKEHGFHAVYGDGPSSFQVEYTACDGVQEGSGGSLTEINGAVYYKSRTGVEIYAGGLPSEIGEELGGDSYHSAVGGSWKHKYYLSMLDGNGSGQLFVYDTALKLWHREESLRAAKIIDFGEDAYLLTSGGYLKTVRGTEGVEDTTVKWMAQTGPMGIDHPDRKYLQRINVRVKLERGSVFRLYIRYDSAGSWISVANMRSAALRAYDFPLRVRRCDHYELKLEGEGPCEVHSIVKTYRTGSDSR